jgi:glycosyltransferase involved in cell wall biosynthesis
MVAPYGLADNLRLDLTKAAAPAQERLSSQTVCFIGMWGLRKGSRDWPAIIRIIRQRYPGAKFLFLGTMCDESVVRTDLGAVHGVTCRSHFSDTELPSLLARCTLAVFPSYIEGFGLAVLEQLAAGLPVVAYDVSGPRQILQSQRDRLLAPVGDVTVLSAKAVEILGLSTVEYEQLSSHCRTLAHGYRWEAIAGNTIERYRLILSSFGTAPSKMQ